MEPPGFSGMREGALKRALANDYVKLKSVVLWKRYALEKEEEDEDID